MPTYQRRESLRRTLEALRAVDYPPERLELVLVCDGCTDGSAEMARALDMPFPVRVLEQPNGGPAAARNLGIANARNPLVLFLDDDVLPSPALVREHAMGHLEAGDGARAVIGTLVQPHRRRPPWVQWELDTVSKQYAAMEAGEYPPTPRQFYTGNASVPRADLVAVNGFDTSFRRAEDVELACRLQAHGVGFVFRSGASGVHVADRSFRSWLRAAYEYGRNDVVLGTRRGRPDLLNAAGREFWSRSRSTRLLVRAGLRLPGIERHLGLPVALAARVALWLGWPRLSHALCSALFNLAYWHGLSDELGSTSAAGRLMAAGAPGHRT